MKQHDNSEAMDKLPHKLHTLIRSLPQAPFRDHLAAECLKQSERIAELEAERDRLLATVKDDTTMIFDLCAERDRRREEVERLRPNAERYEWLRDCHPADESLWVAMGRPHAPGGVSCWRGDELDAALDAARTTHKETE